MSINTAERIENLNSKLLYEFIHDIRARNIEVLGEPIKIDASSSSASKKSSCRRLARSDVPNEKETCHKVAITNESTVEV